MRGPGRLLNGYGPTEATFFASYHLLQQTEPYTGSLPIGYPLSNTALYVLDDELKPVPPNVPGELYISGDAVGIGYLNREDLTRKHFLDDPFRKGERMYRTGDIVKRLADGSLIFIERSDFQVKIRGFRIELSENGNCMERLSGVRDAFVMTVTEPSGVYTLPLFIQPILEQMLSIFEENFTSSCQSTWCLHALFEWIIFRLMPMAKWTEEHCPSIWLKSSRGLWK